MQVSAQDYTHSRQLANTSVYSSRSTLTGHIQTITSFNESEIDSGQNILRGRLLSWLIMSLFKFGG